MTTETSTPPRDLPSELVAHPGWKWTPGALGVEQPGPRMDPDEPLRVARRVIHMGSGPTFEGWQQEGGPARRSGWRPDEDWRPDLEDFGTQGCLAFELLPKAWGPDWYIDIGADASQEVKVWNVEVDHVFEVGPEAAAGVALALLAAPRPEGPT